MSIFLGFIANPVPSICPCHVRIQGSKAAQSERESETSFAKRRSPGMPVEHGAVAVWSLDALWKKLGSWSNRSNRSDFGLLLVSFLCFRPGSPVKFRWETAEAKSWSCFQQNRRRSCSSRGDHPKSRDRPMQRCRGIEELVHESHEFIEW